MAEPRARRSPPRLLIIAAQQACLAARTDALMANSDLDFPTLLAECLPVSQKASAAKARETKQPDDAEAA